jgi:alpha-acetolactate decarboxylase
MDNPVYLDEDIPFVESGDYEIDEATGGGNGATTTMAHGNIISLNHQAHHFDDDSMWPTALPMKRGRRPKGAAVIITTAQTAQKSEPKRRGRKPKQEIFSHKNSLSLTSQTLNDDLLSQSIDEMNQKQQQVLLGVKSNKKLKNEDEHSFSGKHHFLYYLNIFVCDLSAVV